MGFIFGTVKKIIKLILYLGIFIGIIVLIPNLPPYTKFTSIELAPTKERVGPLAPNTALNNGEKLYVDKILGPEAFQLLNGDLYTSLSTGEIVKLSPGGHITFVTKVGQPCTGLTQEHICGRPLGFEIDAKQNVMYVADAYLGIWKVDLKTDKKQLLVSPRVEIKGQVPRLFNSIALAKNGDFYWTDSTSDFGLQDGAISMLTDPSGRLFYYNAAKNESKVLLNNLWFSNGLAISPDNQFVLVAETCKLRILKYYIDGPKKGKSEVFVDGLPGSPDNLRALPDGSGVLVGLYTVFDDDHPLLMRSLAQAPVIRKFLARLQRLVEIPFQYMNTLYPHYLFEEVAYNIGHFKTVSGLLPPMAGLVQIDWSGKIIASYFNTDGSLGHISDAVVLNDKLYLGAPGMQNFIGAVPAPPLLQKAFAQTKTAPKSENVAKDAPKTKEVEKEVPKVAKPEQAKPTQPPKPTDSPKTTTPKPKEQKPTTPPPQATKPTQPPKQAEAKPTAKQPEAKPTAKQSEPIPTTKPPETKPTTKPVEVKSTTPKPQAKPAPASKPVEPKPKPDKPATKPTEAKAQKSASPKIPHDKSRPEQIPIEEEIPSDTAKPSKETLKVIKKGGPTEIPNPHL